MLNRFKSLGLPYSLFALSTAIAATYLAAMISWHAFEKRFLKLKKRFDYGRAPLPQDSPAIAMAFAAERG